MKRTAAIIFRSVILVLMGIAIGLLISDNRITDHIDLNSDKVSKVLDLVRHNYVDSVNVDSIEGSTVNNLLQNLDPHSLYLPPQQLTSINERLEGGFTGIGVEYILLRDTLVITQVTQFGPAYNAGLRPGDKVIEVDHQNFAGTRLTTAKVSKAFRGAKDSQLLMAVIPAGAKTTRFYNIKRDHVDLSSLDAAYMLNPNTGYIKISKFASTTDADFRKALTKLKVDGLQKLVLDIRGNGGGYLNTATALADEFLTKKQLIVYTKGVHEPRTDYFATDSGNFQQGKLAVLIDEYSASASEILAGALQDLDRAVIIGRRSFGKGLVQEQFPFGDGSAINLTIARYYTPSGRSIQKSYAGGTESYRNELAQRMIKGELFSEESNLKDSIFSKPTHYHTSSGRKVFSGGGIMPDIFVPADTTHNTYLSHELNNRQIFSAYVIDHMQPLLKKYTADDFIKNYSVSDAELGSLILYAAQDVKDINPREVMIGKDDLKTMLKAYAARLGWGDNAYFRTINADDPAIKKALEAVR
ncbi:S41 family peptidase [Mucilaginibacter sp. dw_454]|uniref:S41 family peptidase n=1 Tax=Mucilaginibacter sp. dw_454 TaxID=2720079 RepID=UPI001BD3B4A3|nr:S41 family peptidase [Mucilaginibacter sp. dw_454]